MYSAVFTILPQCPTFWQHFSQVHRPKIQKKKSKFGQEIDFLNKKSKNIIQNQKSNVSLLLKKESILGAYGPLNWDFKFCSDNFQILAENLNFLEKSKKTLIWMYCWNTSQF